MMLFFFSKHSKKKKSVLSFLKKKARSNLLFRGFMIVNTITQRKMSYRTFHTEKFRKDNQNKSTIIKKNYENVKMIATRGQFAWFDCLQKKRRSFSTSSKPQQSHQRLNARQQDENFAQWLVGFTEGDGCFFIDSLTKKNKDNHTKKQWVLGFKISQSSYNIRALLYIKKNLQVGTINITADGSAHYRIRNRSHLATYIFPIFNAFPMLTSKYYDYKKVLEAYDILENSEYSSTQREEKMMFLLQQKITYSEVAPIWYETLGASRIDCLLKDNLSKIQYSEVVNVITESWLRGFFEAEASFYIVRKDENRYCHAFSVTQKTSHILYMIRARLHIVPNVRKRLPIKSQKVHYALDVTNSRNLETIKKLCSKKLVSMKSLEFRIWERSFKYKNDYTKLYITQQQLRKLRLSRYMPVL